MKRIVLSIRGGGIRGAIPARILSHLEEQIGPCAKVFDLIGGVSTGGILTCGLVHPQGFSAEHLLELYVSDGPSIFHRDWYETAALLKVKYPASNIEPVLKKYYGETAMLSEATTECLVSARNIVTRRSQFWSRRKALTDPNCDFPLWKVSRATSAAPTYFPPAWWPPSPDGFVDGGVFSTDTALFCWSEAHHLWPNDEIFIVSLGTGYRIDEVPAKQSQQWGELEWLGSLISTFTDGTADALEHVLGEDILDVDHYLQIDAPLVGKLPSPEMDDASPQNIQALIEFADKMAVDQKGVLDRVVQICKP